MKAYLVVHLDTTVTPPVVLGAGVYSESGSTLTGAIRRGRFALDVLDVDGDDYEDAVRRLKATREFYRASGALEWAFTLLDENPRRGGGVW